VAALTGRDDGEAAEAVADGQVRVRWQQCLEHRHTPGHSGDEPRGVVALVKSVWVGAERDEGPGHLDPVEGGGQQ